jgi:hypothetical protein
VRCSSIILILKRILSHYQTVKATELKQLRQHAGQLLAQVLDETISPQWALLHWPKSPLSSEDPSILSAYSALWHLESDLSPQLEQPLYLDVQLALLQQMAQVLLTGNELSEVLIQVYPKQFVRHYFEGQTLLNFFRHPFEKMLWPFRSIYNSFK